MRILVTGSRDWPDTAEGRSVIAEALIEARENPPEAVRSTPPSRLVLVHGAARGADRIAADYSRKWRWDVEPHPAEWQRYGKAAGHRRNAEMVAAGAAVCLAFFRADRPNIGTHDCVRRALAAGIPVRPHDETGPLLSIPGLVTR